MLFLPDGSRYNGDRLDLHILDIVWRGSNVLILTNRDVIKRLSFDDRRKIADELRRVFELDFGPNIYL